MPPAAPPTWRTTTHSGPRPMPSISSAWTSSSTAARRRTSASSEFRTVYWPGCVVSRTPLLARPRADLREPVGEALRLVAEARELGVARVGREARGHPVEADVVVVEVAEDRLEVVERDAEARARTAASRVVRGQPARAEHLHREAEPHPPRALPARLRSSRHAAPCGRPKRRSATLCALVPGQGLPVFARSACRPSGGARDIGRSMPLTLVTGPANAEKARRRARARCASCVEREPILVVPTFADVDRYRRELAEGGLVFGARVETFDRLLREIARRAGVGGRAARAAGPRARRGGRGGRRAAGDRSPASAATPGFAGAACALFDELEAERITPARLFTRRCARGPPRTRRARAYAEELGRLYRAYRERLERLGRRDATLHRAAALDALREEPARWGTTPVLLLRLRRPHRRCSATRSSRSRRPRPRSSSR